MPILKRRIGFLHHYAHNRIFIFFAFFKKSKVFWKMKNGHFKMSKNDFSKKVLEIRKSDFSLSSKNKYLNKSNFQINIRLLFNVIHIFFIYFGYAFIFHTDILNPLQFKITYLNDTRFFSYLEDI